MDELLKEQKPLIDRLSHATGIPVEIVPSSSYESVVDAIVSGGVDIAWLGPASYLLAYQRDPRIEPFASLTISPGYFTPAGHDYQALLLVRSQVASDIQTLRGKRVVLTDPASTSGNIIPNAEFSDKIGMPMARFFGSIAFSGSHDKSLDALLAGKADAGFVSSVRADEYLKRGLIDRNTFKASAIGVAQLSRPPQLAKAPRKRFSRGSQQTVAHSARSFLRTQRRLPGTRGATPDRRARWADSPR
nr:hypothetical protein [Tanacetum cinerariifolium]